MPRLKKHVYFSLDAPRKKNGERENPVYLKAKGYKQKDTFGTLVFYNEITQAGICWSIARHTACD